MLRNGTQVRRIYDGRVGVVVDTASQNPYLATGEIMVWWTGTDIDDAQMIEARSVVPW